MSSGKKSGKAVERGAPADEPVAVPPVSSPDGLEGKIERHAAIAHRALIELFESLPPSEQEELLLDALERRASITVVTGGEHLIWPPRPDAETPFPDAKPEGRSTALLAIWLNAIGEHQQGYGARLQYLVSTMAPMVGVAATYLGDVVAETAKRRTRGRPPKDARLSGTSIRGLLQHHALRVQFHRARDEWSKRPRGERAGATPTVLALREMQTRYAHLSEATLRRIIWPAKAKKSE